MILCRRVGIFVIRFKLTDFFSVSKQIAFIPIVMQTQTNVYLCFTKISTKLFLRCANAAINIISRPARNTKKLFLRLPTFDDELLSIPKITSFLVKLLPKFNETAPSNIILQPLYTCLFLTLFFTILVVPNKQFFKIKLLRRLFSSHLNRRQYKHIQLRSRNCFSLQLKCSYRILQCF